MTDILAGQKIQAATWPKAVDIFDGTSQLNITTTGSYTTGTPTVDLTFVASTTGRALITVTSGARDNTGTDRAVVTFELYRGTSAGGTSIITVAGSTLQYECTAAGEADNYQYVSRTTLVEGLTAGATHYARIMYTSGGGGTADIAFRGLTVRPAP